MRPGGILLALFFVITGTAHFVSPDVYLAIMPPAVPWPAGVMYLTGIAEIAGGLGVLFQRTRRAAGVGLIVLLIAVFPANVYAAGHGMTVADWNVPAWLLWVRLLLQPVLIWWVYRECRKRP